MMSLHINRVDGILMRLMESQMSILCIGILLLFMRHGCETNKHHTVAFGVAPPKDCTPRCVQSLDYTHWCCCGECVFSKNICERDCSEKKREKKSCC
ncbi:hypothetical protein HanPSC8_Chr17g0764361 [Helianthus annuus]|nr:hypothetical protein HanIR_Chr17g0864241 [Helianthus annuus]KAJ0812653.1 hypothetical protein HanPSC8_Chr17g0764361 [Helianthus annuus]